MDSAAPDIPHCQCECGCTYVIISRRSREMGRCIGCRIGMHYGGRDLPQREAKQT